MYAPLPEHMLVVVKPPKAFVDQGIATADEYWTLHKAVYGLRISPRAWGTYRDDTLRAITWKAYDSQSHKQVTYQLTQGLTDSQVWRIMRKEDWSRRAFEDPLPEVLGLIVVYVDDMLLMSPPGNMRDTLVQTLRETWTMKPPTELSLENTITFLGWNYN